jgi:uncharacterized protein (UPF0332 family)
MFYAATALLLNRGLRFRKHSAVLTAINREFVRTGELDHAHFMALQLAFNERNSADYGYDDSVTAETAERVLRGADAFVSAAATMLGA